MPWLALAAVLALAPGAACPVPSAPQERSAETRRETRDDGSVVEYEVEVTPGGEVLHGAWSRRYTSGELAERGTYEHGRRVRRWRSYHENGEKKEIGNYRDDRRDGEWTAYYPNGQKQSQGEYDQGRRVGRWRAWFDDGRTDEELSGIYRFVRVEGGEDGVSYEGDLLDGRPHGSWTTTWPGGATLLEAEYFLGRRTGTWALRDPGGALDPELESGDYSGVGWRRVPGPRTRAETAFDPRELRPLAEAVAAGSGPLDAALDRLLARSEEDAAGIVEGLSARRDEAFAVVIERLRGLDLAGGEARTTATRLARLAELLLGGRSLGWVEGDDAEAVAGMRRAITRAHALWLLTREDPEFWEVVVPAYRPVRAADRNAQLVVAPVPTDRLAPPRVPERYAARLDPGREPDASVARALAWLAAHQGVDGGWSAERFGDACALHEGAACGGAGKPHLEAGVTGLALLAFLADGNSPARGPYRKVVARGVAWLLAHQDPAEGAWGARDYSWIYQHAIATQVLAEVQILSPCVPVREALEAAVGFCQRARNPDRVWRYDYPPQGENDTSVTCWMALALVAAGEAGADVDPAALDAVLAWLSFVTEPETGRVGYDEPGSYSARTSENDRFPRDRAEAMTGAGLAVRFLIEGPGVDPAFVASSWRLLRVHLPRWKPPYEVCDLYAWQWTSLACHLAGGEPAREWGHALADALHAGERLDGAAAGSWDPVGPWGYEGGRVYATAMAALSLQAPWRYAGPREGRR